MKQTLALSVLAVVTRQSVHAAPTITSLSELEFNEDDRLASHYFAYPAGKCAELIDSSKSINDGQWLHKFVALDGEAYSAVFGHLEGIDASAGVPTDVNDFHDCVATCLERGTLQSVVARPLPHRYWKHGEVQDEKEIKNVDTLDQFLTSDACGMVEYGFVSYHENPVKMYWINERTGEKVPNQDLGVGERETSFITTYIGHKFQIYDSEPNEDPLTNEMLVELTIQNHGVLGIKNHEQPPMNREGVAEEVSRTLNSEWKRHLQIKRTFSSLGYDKGRLPDDLYASLGAYYYNNRNPPHKVLEEWGRHKGVFVNYWETDVNFIQVRFHRRSWNNTL